MSAADRLRAEQASQTAARPGGGLPVAAWGAVLAVIALRSLPFLRLVVWPAHSSGSSVLASYLPEDWLQYVALIRQPLAHGGLTLANPFTAEPQDGRLILLPIQALNLVHHATGLDPFWLLELSRVPLAIAFFAALWRFLERLPLDREHRVSAVWLVALSGGLDYLARWLAPVLPSPIRDVITVQLSGLAGWSTFGALWNPLWTAGLTLLLVVLGPALDPDGPRRGRELALLPAAFAALWFTHAYSGIACVVIVCAAWLFSLAAGLDVSWRAMARTGLALGVGLAAVAAVAAWQAGDPVYRATTKNALGALATEVFWYPITIGVVAALALHGRRSWTGERRRWAAQLLGWAVGVALLHSSPLLNGTHFVSYLYVPVCILAAPSFRAAFSHARPAGRAALALAVFGGAPAVTAESVRDAGSYVLPPGLEPLLSTLRSAPPGNVLAPPDLGNIIPAYAPQRVFVGHWFMTPEYEERAAEATRLMSSEDPRAWRSFAAAEHIGYVVAPASSAPRIAGAFPGSSIAVHGAWALVQIEGTR